ncbi:PRAME family member 8-like [Muntiacus reevesi]|uniref:PRAME family member 8-like n=1 Tax=Muntiacus reevesi TaxID=9886 RepID=UPI00330788BD
MRSLGQSLPPSPPACLLPPAGLGRSAARELFSALSQSLCSANGRQCFKSKFKLGTHKSSLRLSSGHSAPTLPQDSNQRRVRMSAHNPPRLVILAAIGLLRDEPSAISALEYLPRELYPPLFMAAVFGRRRETLKAMVPAWPFARLPLGGLMQKPHQGTLQAVLDGLDVLLAQNVHPRRCKLQVLDLRNTGQDFWNMWSGGKDHMPSSSLLAPVAEDMSRIRHALTPLEVYIELCLKKKPLEKFLTYLFRWVEQRKASIHLCCKKMKIISMSKENMKEVLRMVKLDCVQKVKLSFTQKLSTLAQFAPLLGQMSNVQSLILSRIRGSAVEEQDHQDLLQLTSQILRLRDLRDLRMEAPSFLEGRLDQMLRCLKTPLDNISITNCLLTESDLTHLSWCPKLCQLKGLNLSGVTLTDFSPELLQVLLEEVAGTLEELDLNLCGITDVHLTAFLPALSRCSQLRVLSMCGNLISMAILESLLHHTDRLPDLSLELYPAPRESYSALGVLHLERLAQIKAELRVILTGLERPRKIWMPKDPLGPPSSNKLAAYRVRLAPSIPEPNMHQLKDLDLSEVTMTDFSPEILHVLLE